MYWLAWVVAPLLLGIIEVFTVDLFFLTLGVAALLTGIAAAFGVNIWVQLAVFTVASMLLLWLVRPWAKGLLARSTPDLATNAQGLVGMEAVVTAPLTGPGGRVRLQGGDWSARGQGGATFPVGSTVRVVAIDGATAVVGPPTEHVPVPPDSVPEEPLL